MPLSTPVSTEMVAITTATAISAICTTVFSGMPNWKLRPKFNWTTPMPRLVADAENGAEHGGDIDGVPQRPWIRLPRIG